MSADFIYWLYRHDPDCPLKWGDLGGDWPQPLWRTHQDLWYSGIRGEVQGAKADAETRYREQQEALRAHNASRGKWGGPGG